MKGFIEITDQTNTRVLLNVNHILMIKESDGKCIISMIIPGQAFITKESYLDVIELIKKSN